MALSDEGRKYLYDLVYRAIDKASPYVLPMYSQTKTIEVMQNARLTQLQILPQSITHMWLWINAHVAPYAKPIDPLTASKCETVGQVWDAVQKAAV